MRPSELSPYTLRLLGAVIGLAFGAVAAWAADAMPRRHGTSPLTTGTRRLGRNVVLVVLCVICGAALAPVATMFQTHALVTYVASVVLASAVLAAAAVDLEHMILPNEVTLGGALLALVTSPWRSTGLHGALLGALFGALITYLPHVLYKKMKGRSGAGFGDTKLVVMAGAWFGPLGAMYVFAAGAVQFAVAATVVRITGVRIPVPESVKAEIEELRARAANGDAEARDLLEDDPMSAEVGDSESALLTMRLPMGPFLVLSCLEFLFGLGPRAMNTFFRVVDHFAPLQ